jgi:glycosyltransferase involved in cell wall biosynthesis
LLDNIKNTYLLLYPDLEIGGAAKVMVFQSNHIVDRNKVIVCSKKGYYKDLLDNKVKYIDYDFGNKNVPFEKVIKYFQSLCFLFRLIKQKEVKTVINHHRYFSPILFVLKKFLRFKVIFVAHATFKPLPLIRGKIFGDKIIAVSESVSKHLVKNFKVNHSLVSVIYNSVESPQLVEENKKKCIKESLNIRTENIICCIGHFRALKRQDFLLEAFKNVLEITPDCHLILVGFGETEEQLKTNIQSKNIGQNVTIINNNSFSALEILSISKINILPSKREGLGISLIEGFSLGIPGIGTNSTGIKEVITHSENGFLFSFNNVDELKKQIVYLLVNENIRKELGKAAFKTYQNKFTEEIYKKEFDNFLNDTQ